MQIFCFGSAFHSHHFWSVKITGVIVKFATASITIPSPSLENFDKKIRNFTLITAVHLINLTVVKLENTQD